MRILILWSLALLASGAEIATSSMIESDQEAIRVNFISKGETTIAVPDHIKTLGVLGREYYYNKNVNKFKSLSVDKSKKVDSDIKRISRKRTAPTSKTIANHQMNIQRSKFHEARFYISKAENIDSKNIDSKRAGRKRMKDVGPLGREYYFNKREFRQNEQNN